MSSVSKDSVKAGVLVCALLTAPLSEVAAQERPRPAVEFAVGSLAFADDGVVYETMVGGAARLYVSPRLSVGPEVTHITGGNHSHLMLTGNLTFDVLRPANRQPRAVTPYLVAGGGLFQTRQQFPNTGTFTSSEGAFTAGGGVRGRAGDRVLLGADVRIGWELHIRVAATIGVQLGR